MLGRQRVYGHIVCIKPGAGAGGKENAGAGIFLQTSGVDVISYVRDRLASVASTLLRLS